MAGKKGGKKKNKSHNKKNHGEKLMKEDDEASESKIQQREELTAMCEINKKSSNFHT